MVHRVSGNVIDIVEPLELLINIIFGIDEGMKVQTVIDFDQSTTTVKEERNKTLHWMNQISYYDPSSCSY